MPGDRAREVGQAARSQARGTASNLRELWSSWQLDDFLPGFITGFINELFMLIPYALGRGSAYRQIASSVALILIAILSTPFTLGYSLILAAPFVVTLAIGLWRLVPAINDGFTDLRGSKLRDRDVRRWRRD